MDPFADMDSKEYIEKHRKLEADFTAYLMGKYFSDKDIYGGDTFEETATVGGKTIKASRFHPAQSYADPMQYLKDKKLLSSTPAATNKASSSSTPPVNNNNNNKASFPNGKPPVEKDAS